jgi:hypothetical protein
MGEKAREKWEGMKMENIFFKPFKY